MMSRTAPNILIGWVVHTASGKTLSSMLIKNVAKVTAIKLIGLHFAFSIISNNTN